VHELSALLVNRVSAKQFALCRQVRLLVEFAPRRGDEILARSTRPLGIVQTPSSFFAQNGPPGCANRTSRAGLRRNTKMPADLCAAHRRSSSLAAALYRRTFAQPLQTG